MATSGESSHVVGDLHSNGTKVGDDSTEWYIEGPGRRVGYDNMTAIDWIFEYSKERQRLKVLHSTATGVLGYLKQLLDASQVWAVLIATGVAAGIIAACIDITSDWLGDLKTGYCKHGSGGGKFYLNKGFCCWGLEGKVSHIGPIKAILPCLIAFLLILLVIPQFSSPVFKADETDCIEWSQCQDWTPWSSAVRVNSKSGRYIIEYLFFTLYSVCEDQ